ncbi:hypothetical protein [Microbacterium cremeum]|uniref:hypothetical protein n=1 Tax=Microbacterium cremeum TaxID=2782169 RepID=UPI0018885DA5|nr:hypothetical protein [Microbacterium cremeum]
MAGLVVAFTVALAGCTGAPQPEAEKPAEQVTADASSDAPEECADAFPHAIGTPSLAEVEALPADWPEPPAGSTLCLTASALGDGGSESISYATPATADAVLAYYEDALGGYSVARETSPTGGEMLVGDGGAVSFQIRPGEGSIVIALVSTG